MFAFDLNFAFSKFLLEKFSLNYQSRTPTMMNKKVLCDVFSLHF